MEVRKLFHLLESEKPVGMIESIPSYSELMVCFDPLKTDGESILDQIRQLEPQIVNVELPSSRMLHIPVLYGGESGMDLYAVAEMNKLTIDEVISIHTEGSYLVYMLGFTPGFCYLGGLDKRIAAPRKKDPRLRIPAGSVGIAGDQTGIYPLESPGGWNIIGKTPLILFDHSRVPAFLAGPGDYIRFFAINNEEYMSILDSVTSGSYCLRITRNH